ncbi:MAG: hypothetical protein NVV62_19640 [Terricaulis sp.]|nr:hypothetical protein [Terricaulis sp.]
MPNPVIVKSLRRTAIAGAGALALLAGFAAPALISRPADAQEITPAASQHQAARP